MKTFEESLKRLEEISRRLDDPALTLDESVTLLEESIALSNACMRSLSEKKGRITELKKELDTLTEIPFGG
jgi:exodeoxyribonuclease VII small subunit